MTIHTTAVAEVRASFENRLASLKAALEINPHGYVFCWDRYGLGVKIANGGPRTVGVEDATVTSKTDRRIFRNGSNERALLMPRREALEAALASVAASYAHLEAALAKA